MTNKPTPEELDKILWELDWILRKKLTSIILDVRGNFTNNDLIYILSKLRPYINTFSSTQYVSSEVSDDKNWVWAVALNEKGLIFREDMWFEAEHKIQEENRRIREWSAWSADRTKKTYWFSIVALIISIVLALMKIYEYINPISN